MNHVDEDQIDGIMKAFRKLDQDGSGSLSVSDLAGNLRSEKKKRKEAMKLAEGVSDFVPTDESCKVEDVSVPSKTDNTEFL
jgi:Ca2+-binding EF-hand superfamily protein